jgi:thiol-disulfide isomerase/thioredoxin
METARSQRRDLASGLALTITMGLAFALVLGRVVEVASGPTAPPRGEPAPAFSAETLEGRAVELSDFEGKVVLLDFWATWCPPCVATLPQLEALHRAHADEGLVVLGVNQEPDRVDQVRAFLRRHDVTFPSVRDDRDIAWRYGVHSYPTSVLIGPDQRVLKTYRGPPPPDRLARDVRAALDARAGDSG